MKGKLQMCGRYQQAASAGQLRAIFEIQDTPEAGADDIATGIISPGQKAAVIRRKKDKKQLHPLLWGFVPHWAKDMKGSRFINARAETAAEKPSFRDAFQSRRCVIPADAFYEWDAREQPKAPYRIQPENKAPFAFAGLWDAWQNPQTGEIIESFAILTTAATAAMQGCHDRMPVMLTTAAALTLWLDPASPGPTLHKLLQPEQQPALVLSPATEMPQKPAESQQDSRQGRLF